MTMGISEFTASIPVYGNGTSSSKPGMNFAKSTAFVGRTPSTSAMVRAPFTACAHRDLRESAGKIKDGGPINFSVCKSRCLARNDCLRFMFKYDDKGYCVLQLERLLYGYWLPGSETAMFLQVEKSETDRSNFTRMTELLEMTCPVQKSLPLPPENSNATTRNIVITCTLFAAELISSSDMQRRKGREGFGG
ncbi:hypothetical protein ACFX13_027804 [Malus domestica]